jgi:cytoskeletal protein CcmA (bactofilin family)
VILNYIQGGFPMAHRFVNKSALYLTLLLVMILVFGLVQPAAAQGIIYGDKVPTDTQVDQNLILTGYNVTIDGTVNGDVIAVGSRVTINGVVNGSLITVGEYININGEVTGSVYSAALALNMGSSSVIDRDLYFLGIQLNMNQGSVINRDLYTISLLSASMAGKVNRNTYAEIGPSAVVQMIFDLAGWPLPNWLGSGALPPAWTAQHFAQAPFTLASANPVTFQGAGLAILSSTSASSDGYYLMPAAEVDPQRLTDWGLGLLRNLVALLLVGLIIAWLLPSLLNQSSERLRAHPWSSVGWGLMVYLLGWFLFGLLFTLIIALTIFFFTVSFVNLGFVVGGVGLASLSLAFMIFWVSVFFISKIVVALLLGRLLIGLVSKKAASGRLVPLFFGVILYALLASIPYLGFVISSLATFFGLGALWIALRQIRKAPAADAWVETPPAVEALAEKAPETPAPLSEADVVNPPEPVAEMVEAVAPVEEPPAQSSDNPEEFVKTTPLDEPPAMDTSEAEKPDNKGKKKI